MKYITEVLICPSCAGAGAFLERSDQLACRNCGATYQLENGIPNLITGPTLTTALENIDYDRVHGISQAGRLKTYAGWEEVFGELKIGKGRVLEIGSGTGNLTWGLMHQSSFDEVYATDLSGKYLAYIADHFSEGSKNKTYYYICDANRLPFREGMFDVVVGHSVLHHLLHYEQMLQSVQRMLTKGGSAIFFEPLIQGKIVVSFMIDLMQRIDSSFQLNILSQEERSKILRQVKHHTKGAMIKGDKDILKNMEDKYIFDVNMLKALSDNAGYTRFQMRSLKKLDTSYRSYVAFQWALLGLDEEKLKRFEEIFNAFGGTIGLMLGESLSAPMCYLIFQK